MRFIIAYILVLTASPVAAQRYQKVHNKAVVVDTHNDILTTAINKNLAIDGDLRGKTHSDLERWKKGGIDVQLFSVWCDGKQQNPYAWANREMDTLYAVARRNLKKIAIVDGPQSLRLAVRQKKLAAMFGVEGGHMIEDNLDHIDTFYKRGARYMTLTWNNSTSWATSAMDESTKKDSLPHKGLTDFGKQVVKRMNHLGMMVDLSHAGEQTFWDAISVTTKPVLVSHSCSYTLCPVFRNLKDEQILAIGKNGGVIHINFFPLFIDSSYGKRFAAFNLLHQAEKDAILKINPDPDDAQEFILKKYSAEADLFRPPLSMLIDHIDYVVKLIGVDHVGLGSDFDGIPTLPGQLHDVSDMPAITKELRKRGYSKNEIYKILGGNFLRLLAANSTRP